MRSRQCCNEGPLHGLSARLGDWSAHAGHQCRNRWRPDATADHALADDDSQGHGRRLPADRHQQCSQWTGRRALSPMGSLRHRDDLDGGGYDVLSRDVQELEEYVATRGMSVEQLSGSASDQVRPISSNQIGLSGGKASPWSAQGLQSETAWSGDH